MGKGLYLQSDTAAPKPHEKTAEHRSEGSFQSGGSLTAVGYLQQPGKHRVAGTFREKRKRLLQKERNPQLPQQSGQAGKYQHPSAY